MSFGILILLLCGAASSLLSSSFDSEWEQFKTLHKTSYQNNSHEMTRREIFEVNLQRIHQHNVLYEQGMKSYKLGVNPFADMTSEEFKNFLTLKQSSAEERSARSLFLVPRNKSAIPPRVDWRRKGAVTPVKQQGSCGSCWAFSVTGSLEGQYFLKHGTLLSFSEQQLIDCASEEYGAYGCSGGTLDAGFGYIRDQGIEAEATYPYRMSEDVCQANETLTEVRIQSFVNIEENNEDALLAAVGLIGPVSVAFDASQFDMQFYKEGIYESSTCSQTELNHGVLIVGYGSLNGTDYWIIKNSWGLHFGIEGYMLMKRGVNQCGVALDPSYPVL
ncbi:procathepsin L isoform X1 [Dendroctonus ponderosae]|nr:procathepsin L isoform X1 [Dendroctonus ponderosae]KAH1012720.1 hypothetical protein HUJ05_011824 [Dendroctonus ponderosae]